MCLHKRVPEDNSCESGITTDPPTPDTNCTFNDGQPYGLEMDIRSGYHAVMSGNSSYDNVSNPRTVPRSRHYTCHIVSQLVSAVVTRIFKGYEAGQRVQSRNYKRLPI
jgi:hypothetical protein